MTTKCWKFRNFCFNQNRKQWRGAHRTKKILQLILSVGFFFSQARTRKSQFIEKCDPFLFIWFLSISFCNKAMSVQGRTAFTTPVHINPSSPTHVGFRWFSMELHTRGLTRHIIASIDTQLERNQAPTKSRCDCYSSHDKRTHTFRLFEGDWISYWRQKN